MVGVGEYQYGFDSVEELLSTTTSEEVQDYARQEAGRIAGSLEPVDLADVDQGRDNHDLKECLANAFQADSELVEQAAKQGKISFKEMFDLMAHVPSKQVFRGGVSASHAISLGEDVAVSRLALTDEGKLAWQTHVALKAGETVGGYAHTTTATVPVDGGYVVLGEGSFQATPVPRRPHCL